MTLYIQRLKYVSTIALVVMMFAGLVSCGGSGSGSGGESQVMIMPPPSQGRPDLTMALLSASDNGQAGGITLSLSATVRNDGDGTSPSAMLQFYQSTDNTITTSDTVVGSGVVLELSASSSVSVSVDVTAPSTPGTYYFGACVDAVADESDTTNNCSASVQVIVLEGQQQSQGNPALLVASVSVSNGSPLAGTTFTLSATVRNDGDGTSPSTALRYYRSTDVTITTFDTAVRTGYLLGLSASGSISVSVDLTAPSTPGTYYYGVCVDAVAGESDTANNCSASVEVTVLETQQPQHGAPDLVVGPPSVSSDSCAAGANFTLSATVRNTGNLQSPATTLRYYRSEDATITTSDTEAGTDTVRELGALESSSQSVILNMPSSPETHYYGACVDTVAGESDANNNCSASVLVSVVGSQDLTNDQNGTRTGASNLGDITESSSSSGQNGRIDSIGGPGDRVDYYRFSLSEEKRVEFVLRTVHRPETRTDLFLEDDTGDVLRQKTDTAEGAVSLSKTLRAGTYYVRVEDDSGCLSIYFFSYIVSE